jgi:hypothetical protein
MIRFEMHETLDQETILKLWDQNIIMDDWNYVLFIDEEFNSEFLEIPHFPTTILLHPKSIYISDLLQGSYENRWYAVNDFMGRKGILGVAYHG